MEVRTTDFGRYVQGINFESRISIIDFINCDTKGFLKRNLTCIIWILLYGTIRAFELVSGRQFAQRIARNTMAAGESHWWVGVGSLLPQDRTRKYAVETTVRAKIYLDRQFVLGVVPYAGDLALLHNLWTNF